MLVLIALQGCHTDEVHTTEDGAARVQVVEAADPPAALGIATVPDRAERARAPVISGALPQGEVIVRDCGAGGSFGRSTGVVGGAPKGSGGGATRRPQPRPAPAPAPTPAPLRERAQRPASQPDAAAPAEAVTAEPAAAPQAEPPPPPAKPVELAKEKKDVARAPASELEPAPDRGVAEEGRIATRPKLAAADEQEQARPEQPAAHLDWGATVFLSNDDSMSLASAQRVLYALKRGLPVRTSEIRPHELLNYFSFDTVDPAPGTTFGVLGAAEQDGDTLSVALAVRGANPARQPLDLSLVVDRSCSMAAEDRVGYTKRGLNLLAESLQRGDRVDVVLFDDQVCTPLENWVAGRDDVALLRDAIAQIQPTGATDLDAGLREAWRIQTARDAGDVHGRNRRVLVVTDALLNRGRVDPALVSEIGENLDRHGIRLSGVGVGLEFDDEVLDQLTEKGKGAYVYLGSEAVVDRVFGPGFDSLVRTIAHDVRFSLDLPESLAMERFYGEESSTNAEDVQPIHYFAGTTQLFLQDLKVRDGVTRREDPITLRIEYRDAISGEPAVQELRTTVGALLDGDPHNLRKARALMAFADVVTARSMGADPCGAPLGAYRERAARLPDDAEIGFVNGLVGPLCRVDLSTSVARGVELKLKVDSDQPIGEVTLQCPGRDHVDQLSGGDTVARFTSVAPGACRVRLDGQVPMLADLEVPTTGGDVRCVVRAGRVSCG